jgi:hypothetical protein
VELTTTARAGPGGSAAEPDAPDFGSVLWQDGPRDDLDAAEPDYFTDLRLDQLVSAILSGRERYRLEGVFRTALSDVPEISSRQAVFDELGGDPHLLEGLRTFARGMDAVRATLERSEKAYYRYERERWLLEAVRSYVGIVRELAAALAKPRARALADLAAYVRAYLASDGFTTLDRDAKEVRAGLDSLRYSLNIAGTRIRVRRYASEPDYGAEVTRTFERFRQHDDRQYDFMLTTSPEMTHVEAEILERVALLEPAPFSALSTFVADHASFVDPPIGRFDREVQFFVAYLEHAERLRSRGLALTLPRISDRTKGFEASDTYDIALATSLLGSPGTLVTNDVALRGDERIIVVTGPNQGGKTTFARTVGQLHHLAALGCPVPGNDVRIHVVDRVFTHFERVERLEEMTGKLEADLVRVKAILDEATSRSLVILNESFSSTTATDAAALTAAVMRTIVERDTECVCVTFLDEFATTVVSYVTQVDPADPARRTFKVVRAAADGRAYAVALARKHGLTTEDVERRIGA